MDKQRLDELVQDISAPLFIYRMSKPVEDNPDRRDYTERIRKGAQTKMENARQELHDLVMAYAKEQG